MVDSVEMPALSPPIKKRRNSSRIGDLREEDFSTPRRRVRYLEMTKNTVSNIRRKKKILLQKNQRLNKKVVTL